jgi:hypothetical protein
MSLRHACASVVVALLLGSLSLPGARRAAAQTPGDTLLRAAGPQYEAGSVRRFLHGSNWRELWTMPVSVTVLDVRAFAGGLLPERRGGGSQSITLHMVDAAGDGWIFRSIDKYPHFGLPREARGTPAAFIVADHVSILHPGSHFVMPDLLEAAGILHVRPQLFVMPDDAVLGEFRAEFAGMLGGLERRPNQGPGGTPGFAGSRRIRGTTGFLAELDASHEHLLDEREFLRARLMDFLVGDPDRGSDQWRWARFGESGAYSWRPIPRDRDWALAHADGALASLLPRLARDLYGKLPRFGPRYPAIDVLTFSTHVLDRRLLTRLTREDFAVEAAHVQAALTDDVIASAVAALPREWQALSGAGLVAALRARRDGLPRMADVFYGWLAGEVDVRGTDEADLAEIHRNADGTVLVRIRPLPPAADASQREPAPNPAVDPLAGSAAASPAAAAAAAPAPAPAAGPVFYERLFRPGETREVRVHLQDGDDHARITGSAAGPIRLRVIGGGGSNVLEDLAGGVQFHDHGGTSRIIRAPGTRLDVAEWWAPEPPEGIRANLEWAPDWGAARSYGALIDYHDRSGVLAGARAQYVRYGFRRLPHRLHIDMRALHAARSPGRGGASAQLTLDYRLQNSRRSVLLEADASTLETFRFHGLGNDAAALDAAGTRLTYGEVRLAPSLRWHVGLRAGRVAGPGADAQTDDAAALDDAGALGALPAAPRLEGTFLIGGVLGRTAPWQPAGEVLDTAVPAAAVTRLGLRAAIDLRRADRPAVPRRGFRLRAETAAYPAVDGPAGAFGNVAADAAFYVPLAGDGPHLALRGGGEHVFGDFPLFGAAFVGGRHSLRGFRMDRFAGDAGMYGAAELRIPLDTVTLLLRTEAGLLAFGDAGRVWHGGASPGGWHTGYGAGAWLAAFGAGASFAVARGDGTRAYLWLGLPF